MGSRCVSEFSNQFATIFRGFLRGETTGILEQGCPWLRFPGNLGEQITFVLVTESPTCHGEWVGKELPPAKRSMPRNAVPSTEVTESSITVHWGRFCLSVLQACLSISIAPASSNAAASKPRACPPAPAQISNTVSFIPILARLLCSWSELRLNYELFCRSFEKGNFNMLRKSMGCQGANIRFLFATPETSLPGNSIPVFGDKLSSRRIMRRNGSKD